jgi:hypothetical protein
MRCTGWFGIWVLLLGGRAKGDALLGVIIDEMEIEDYAM